MHSHMTTEQPGELAAMCWSNRPSVPPSPWSSSVITTAAWWSRGKYQNRGSALRSRSISVIRLTSSRCCSSAWGIAIRVVSSQSG